MASSFSDVEIIFEDNDIVVVNKPSGLIVHIAPGHEGVSLADILARTRKAMKSVGSSQRPGVVHRLDIETSGVMVFAKTQRAYLALRNAFEKHTQVTKTYLAVLHGVPQAGKSGSLETLIGRKPWDAKRMAVDVPDGKMAYTSWEVLSRKGSLSLVEFKITTGRTHQIRVHSAHLGSPIVGDRLYGDAVKDARLRRRPKRMLLHAVGLNFNHPITGKSLEFSALPPEDIVYSC